MDMENSMNIFELRLNQLDGKIDGFPLPFPLFHYYLGMHMSHSLRRVISHENRENT